METILIVDDDSVMCTVLEHMLKDDSYEVLTAHNGIEAQEIVRSTEKKISSVLLDWQMPEMNGIEFLKWIKKEPDHDHIPVILETSMTMPENIREGIDAGAFYYLTKPIEAEVLRAIVRAAISDLQQKELLLQRIRKSDNPLGQLVEATFRYRTTSEAEFLAVAIANSSPVPQKALMISEILTNAIEHGNLGITYQEKTSLVANNALNQEVERRLSLPKFAQMFVTLRIRRSENGIIVEIEDQGDGFDFHNYLQMDESRVFDNHGRGIALTNQYLKLEYVGKGNKVIVSIPNE
jgi:CheY-like chemotaxis protein/anti-sigma regulatory factor (Ser/Thr protein kinase)